MKIVNYRPSAKLYALDWNAMEVTPHEGSTPAYDYLSVKIPAVWTHTKNKVTTVSMGFIHDSINLSNFKGVTVRAYLEANFDCRYGGSPTASWDGSILWNPEKTPLDTMIAQRGVLDPMLNSLPQPPAAYEGWYDLKD